MQEPEKTPNKQGLLASPVSFSELVRQKSGLVNNVNPPKPQPPKSQKPSRLGGSAARKILKRQR